jgi:hypothetical protein
MFQCRANDDSSHGSAPGLKNLFAREAATI